MRTIREIENDKRQAWARMQAIWDAARAEGRAMNESESAEYETLGQTIDALDGEVRQINEHAERERRMAEVRRDERLLPGGGAAAEREKLDAEYRGVLNRYLRFGRDELDPSEIRLLRRGYVSHADGEQRAQASVPGTAGGYLVPDAFSNRIVETISIFGGARQIAEVMETGDGREIPMPTSDETAVEGRRVADNVAATATDLSFGSRTLRAYLYSSDIVLVPISLLQDADFDLEAYIARKLGERLGRIENREATLGTGNGMPQGFTVGGSVGKTFASATAVTYAELVDLEHSVDPAYRVNARYTFRDSSLAALRKLVDGNGRPLWLPSTAGLEGAGAPATFNSYPYTVNNNMPAMTTGNRSFGFGDFRQGFVWREVRGVTILRLEERYADSFQVAFLGFARMDAAVVNASAFKLGAQA